MKVKITSFILLLFLLFGVVVPVEGKLTENGKNWIAEKFGIKVGDKYCYSYDSPTFYWYDPDEKIEKTDSGTANAVSVLLTAHLTGKESEVYVRIGDKKYYYSDLKAGNDGQDLTLDDAKWVADNDGYPTGESQYCYTPTAPPLTPAHTPTQTLTIPQITQTKTTPSTPGFEAIIVAITITLFLIIRRY